MTDIERAIAYHERTKHFPNRYARSPGYLDWETQPDPFRRYAGARLYELPFVRDLTPDYDALYGQRLDSRPLNIESLSEFLEMSLAISAWKEFQGTRWALRCNPSSGNLHPTEGYILCAGMAGLDDDPALYHYAVKEHTLERRALIAPESWRCSGDMFLVGLSSIYWREAWKYGERAFRYCQHDAGHAIAALRYAAASLGWQAKLLDEMSDDEVGHLLGLDRMEEFPQDEDEHPDVVMLVHTGATEAETVSSDTIKHTEWFGKVNTLSPDHVQWEVIDQVAAVTRKPQTNKKPYTFADTASQHKQHGALTSKQLFKQRRSAVDMDGKTPIAHEAFYTMLERTLPRQGRPPFDVSPLAPAVHLGLFVHRVDGLEPGMYLLLRNRDAASGLKEAMSPEFLWEHHPGDLHDLPLFGLGYGDCRNFAVGASCGQAIAGESAFSLGMIAEFRSTLEREGAWAYRRLFREAGMIGQTLYLEAEAAGLRATGIGCYFDDVVHHAFGLKGNAYQSMYHFTVGGPVEDSRLTTLPPYPAARTGSSTQKTD